MVVVKAQIGLLHETFRGQILELKASNAASEGQILELKALNTTSVREIRELKVLHINSEGAQEGRREAERAPAGCASERHNFGRP
jgi:hypothetical protein